MLVASRAPKSEEAGLLGTSCTAARSAPRVALVSLSFTALAFAFAANVGCDPPPTNSPRFWDEHTTRASLQQDADDPGTGGAGTDPMDTGGAGGTEASGGSGGAQNGNGGSGGIANLGSGGA